MSETIEPPAKVTRGNTRNVLEMAAWLVENGWSLLKKESQLEEKTPSSSAQLLPLSRRFSQLDVFLVYLPSILWDLLERITNRNLAKRVSSDGRHKTTTRFELMKW